MFWILTACRSYCTHFSSQLHRNCNWTCVMRRGWRVLFSRIPLEESALFCVCDKNHVPTICINLCPWNRPMRRLFFRCNYEMGWNHQANLRILDSLRWSPGMPELLITLITLITYSHHFPLRGPSWPSVAPWRRSAFSWVQWHQPLGGNKNRTCR